MHHIINCLKNGLYIAASSFSMLYQHPILLIYNAIPTLLLALFAIVSYNFNFNQDLFNMSTCLQLSSIDQMNPVTNPYGSFMLYFALILSFLGIVCRAYFDVALIKHTQAIHKNQPTTIAHILKATLTQLPLIFQWSLLITAITVVLYSLSLLPFNIEVIFALTIALSLAWSLSNFFMLPVIALEGRPIIDDFKRSVQLIKRGALEVCGGMFWVVLLSLLVNILTSYPLPEMFSLVSTVIALVANIVFAAATLIFKTKVYNLLTRVDNSVDHR